ncbi:MAG: hypothetical protein GQ540_03000 [Lutibacter sp.]|nr:hypothetical protein [Lutibacter sp.]NOR27478.1 hypothetical protein [Lutibacter sp.]
MKTINLTERSTLTSITNFARRNYNTYVKHYESRNLKPMPLEDFLKNYNS